MWARLARDSAGMAYDVDFIVHERALGWTL
jgi:hypothetical protein